MNKPSTFKFASSKSQTPVVSQTKLRSTTRTRSFHPVKTPDGFTLIELLIVMVILPLVLGAIGVSLLSLFKNQVAISNRLTSSGDAQVISASYYHDLQSASFITTLTVPMSVPAPFAMCGPTEIVGLKWFSQSGETETLVSYMVVPNGGTTYSLERSLCNNVPVTTVGNVTPTSTTTLATNLPTSSLQPVITGFSCSTLTGTCFNALTAAAAGWASTLGVESVSLDINDAGSAGVNGGGWSYSLGAVPRNWLPINCPAPGPSCVPHVPPFKLSGPAFVMAPSGGRPQTRIDGSKCSINAPSIGLNDTALRIAGNGNPFQMPVDLYSKSGNQITIGKGANAIKLTVTSFVSGDPLATVQLPLTSTSISGFPNIVTISNGWPTIGLPTGGTIYYVTDSSLSNLPTFSTVSSGVASVIIWDTAATQLTMRGDLNLGPQGVLYAPNAQLTLDGNSSIQAGNVIVNNFICEGGGSTLNLGLTRP